MSTVIDLGKLRFNWAGEWASNTQYEMNDIVRHGGNTFVYIYSLKSSGSVTTDLTRWALVQEGMSWQGDYSSSVAYKPNQVVHHANNSYVCILEEPTAGNAPPDSNYWQLLVTGFKFEGLYSGSAAYEVDDIVYYGANTFICIQNSSGGNNPEDAAFWSTFSHGVQWEGLFNSASAYQKDDVVAYGANTYIAKKDTTGNLPTDTVNWDAMNGGIAWGGAYQAATAYNKGDLVTYGVNSYIATQDTTGNIPTVTTHWDAMSTGISWKSAFNAATAYNKNDVVSYGANTYIATQDTTANLPTVTTHWDLLSAGMAWSDEFNVATAYNKYDVVSYGANTYIATQDTTGNLPTDAANWDALNSGIAGKGAWSASTSYFRDDVVSHGGQTFIALTTHSSGTDFAPDLAASNWVKFSGGLDWKGNWATATAYKVNDVVNSGGATYIVNADHTSTSFAADTANWDSFANAGTDVGLTIASQGDVLYRDATGPAALSAGTSGQVLTTGGANADPTWADAQAGFDVEGTLTTQGDVLIKGSSAVERLATGTAGQVLTAGGAGVNPTWASPVAASFFKTPLKTINWTMQQFAPHIDWGCVNTTSYGWMIERSYQVTTNRKQFAMLSGGCRPTAQGGNIHSGFPYQIDDNDDIHFGSHHNIWTNGSSSSDFSTCQITHDQTSGWYHYGGNIPWPGRSSHYSGHGWARLRGDNGGFNYAGYTDGQGIHGGNGQNGAWCNPNNKDVSVGCNAGYSNSDSRTRIISYRTTSGSFYSDQQNPGANTSTTPVGQLLFSENANGMCVSPAVTGWAHWRNSSQQINARVFGYNSGGTSPYTDYNSGGDWNSPYASNSNYLLGVVLQDGRAILYHAGANQGGGTEAYVYSAHNSRTAVPAGHTIPVIKPWESAHMGVPSMTIPDGENAWIVGHASDQHFRLWRVSINPSTLEWTNHGELFYDIDGSSYMKLSALPSGNIAVTYRKSSGVCMIKIYPRPTVSDFL
jgi:hypothetical protein